MKYDLEIQLPQVKVLCTKQSYKVFAAQLNISAKFGE
jgi:hypothetical protein